MKKILIACIGTNLGGIEKSLIEFLKYLSTKNCQVDLIHWKKPGELYGQIPDTVNILPRLAPMGIQEIKKLRNPWRIIKALSWYFVLQICKCARKPWKCFKRVKKHYDIAISYCQNGDSPDYVIDKVSADKKYLWYHHGSYEAVGKDYQRDQKYFTRYDKVVAVSAPCKAMLWQKFPQCNFAVIHNIVNADEIRRLANDPIADMDSSAKWKFITVSRYSYEKGIDIAIETAKCLKDRSADFVWYFVGDGGYRSEAESLIEKYALQEECKLLGSRNNPYPYTKQADIYVQCSRVEAHPIAIVEALVLGKAIVSTNIPSIMKVTEQGKLALCVEPTPDQLADAICQLIGDPKVMQEYAERAASANIGISDTYSAIDALLGV